MKSVHTYLSLGCCWNELLQQPMLLQPIILHIWTYVRSSSIVFVYALLTQISKAICNECWCCLSSWWACCVIRIASSHVNWRAISVCGVCASMYCMYGEFNKRYLDASRRNDSNSIDISSHNWILHNFRLSHTTLLNEYRQVSTK